MEPREVTRLAEADVRTTQVNTRGQLQLGPPVSTIFHHTLGPPSGVSIPDPPTQLKDIKSVKQTFLSSPP